MSAAKRGRGHGRLPATARVAEIAPDELAEDSDNARINLYDLQKALAQLPERQREIFILRYLEGFSTRETAEIAGCGEGTVKTHLARAAAKVEAFFKAGPDRRPDADIRINQLHLTGERT